MDLTTLTDWVRNNQPLINFGLLVGAVLYTFITGWILRVSVRQLRAAVQPALTLSNSRADVVVADRSHSVRLDVLALQNSGPGTAMNVRTRIAVHSGSGLNRLPRFDIESTQVPSAVPSGGQLRIPSLHSAVETEKNSIGELLYKQLYQYEAFLHYESLVGTKYVTHMSIGLAARIESSFVGRDSVIRRIRLWAGIVWRFYRQWIPIWVKARSVTRKG